MRKTKDKDFSTILSVQERLRTLRKWEVAGHLLDSHSRDPTFSGLSCLVVVPDFIGASLSGVGNGGLLLVKDSPLSCSVIMLVVVSGIGSALRLTGPTTRPVFQVDDRCHLTKRHRL